MAGKKALISTELDYSVHTCKKDSPLEQSLTQKWCRGPLMLVYSSSMTCLTLHYQRMRQISIYKCLLQHEDRCSGAPSHGQLQRTLQGHWVGVRLWSSEHSTLCKERSSDSAATVRLMDNAVWVRIILCVSVMSVCHLRRVLSTLLLF